jgi:hypothetical protein
MVCMEEKREYGFGGRDDGLHASWKSGSLCLILRWKQKIFYEYLKNIFL